MHFQLRGCRKICFKAEEAKESKGPKVAGGSVPAVHTQQQNDGRSTTGPAAAPAAAAPVAATAAAKAGGKAHASSKALQQKCIITEDLRKLAGRWSCDVRDVIVRGVCVLQSCSVAHGAARPSYKM